jgi:transcriptional regulator GlxA family with amidase domain
MDRNWPERQYSLKLGHPLIEAKGVEMRRNTIAVVAFDGISPFHLSVPCLVFGEDRSEEGIPRFELWVCADQRKLRTTSGFHIEALAGHVRDRKKSRLKCEGDTIAASAVQALLRASCSRNCSDAMKVPTAQRGSRLAGAATVR